MCDDTCARVCVDACGFVCWNPTFKLFVFFALLAAAAAYSHGHHCYACVDPCYACLVMMYSCTYSHGTTAIAQQVCVDHLYACVDIAYILMYV